jgi:hypothetical protein
MIVTIPKDITIRLHLDNGRLIDARLDAPDLPREFGPAEPTRFVDFVRKSVLADSKFGLGIESIYLALEIRKALDGKMPGDEVELSKTHVDKVIEILKAPAGGFQPLLAIHLTPFFEAFTKAV